MPLPCIPGTYQDELGQTTCKKCTDPQYYCPDGRLRKVTSGYYSTTNKGDSAYDQTTFTAEAECGGPQYYCQDGKQYKVDDGHYSTGGGADGKTRTAQAECGGPQYYCQDGVRHNVTEGYYSTGGDSENTRTGQAPWTTCQPGQQVATAGTDGSDRICKQCTGDTYTNTTNASSCTSCRTDQGQRANSDHTGCECETFFVELYDDANLAFNIQDGPGADGPNHYDDLRKWKWDGKEENWDNEIRSFKVLSGYGTIHLYRGYNLSGSVLFPYRTQDFDAHNRGFQITLSDTGVAYSGHTGSLQVESKCSV